MEEEKKSEVRSIVAGTPTPMQMLVGAIASSRTGPAMQNLPAKSDIGVKETNTERCNRILSSVSESQKVPGRTLPKGFQWNDIEVEGRGKAAARRLRQQVAQQEREKERSVREASQRAQWDTEDGNEF